MILHTWGELPYEEAMLRMQNLHKTALQDGQNHLILTSHPACFTVGKEHWHTPWPVPVIRTDRGGAITCHSPGQQIYYFCFQAHNPPYFFRKVRQAFTSFFDSLGLPIYYDRKNPGFYIANRKLCSLGFRYVSGVSLHGVALNVDVDLDLHNQVHPCGLAHISATSLAAEGSFLTYDAVRKRVVSEIERAFHDPL